MHSGCMASQRRISVTLEGPDQQAIEAFADQSRPEHATLEEWASQHGIGIRGASEAAIVRVLARAGAEALREKALEEGYARLAADRQADRDERRALRDRAAARYVE